ncbi:MAG: hypothetical protein OXE84_03895 [Rhodobacteraceae bacterium]|nr:hypothetical protein [Paracoccaceae bacterium]MCY4196966.1 hypothetical protein [Paracoccaceae bacterium]MCY4328309.1 hypothetical protein [Paracoccaceae bacterium]
MEGDWSSLLEMSPINSPAVVRDGKLISNPQMANFPKTEFIVIRPLQKLRMRFSTTLHRPKTGKSQKQGQETPDPTRKGARALLSDQSSITNPHRTCLIVHMVLKLQKTTGQLAERGQVEKSRSDTQSEQMQQNKQRHPETEKRNGLSSGMQTGCRKTIDP